YHRIIPLCRTTRTISLAICRFVPASSTELKTVDCKTKSKLLEGESILVALLQRTITPLGHNRLHSSTRSESKSKPTIFSGHAPHWINSRNQKPLPHPTSRIFISSKDVWPSRANNANTLRSRS